MDVRTELRPDHRELGKGRVLDPLDERVLGAIEEPEDRDQKEQKRKERQESVEREERRQRAAAIIAELLEDTDSKGHRPNALLHLVRLPGEPLNCVHRTSVDRREDSVTLGMQSRIAVTCLPPRARRSSSLTPSCTGQPDTMGTVVRGDGKVHGWARRERHGEARQLSHQAGSQADTRADGSPFTRALPRPAIRDSRAPCTEPPLGSPARARRRAGLLGASQRAPETPEKNHLAVHTEDHPSNMRASKAKSRRVSTGVAE